MSVVGSAQERGNSPEATFDYQQYRITRRFLVRTNSKNDGPMTVCSATGIPALEDYYSTGTETWTYAVCKSLKAERLTPASLYWEVTAEYTTPDLKDGDKGTGVETPGEHNNPLLELATVKTSFTTHEEIITQVAAGGNAATPASSSAGEPYDPPPKRQSRYLVLEISRNEPLAAPHPALSVFYQNTVNNDYFWGFPPGQVKCQQIAAERQVRQLQSGLVFAFLRVTYTFEIRETWDLQLLDYGNYYLQSTASLFQVNGTQQLRQFTTDEGHPRTGLLDGTGKALAWNVPVTVSGDTFTVTAPATGPNWTFSNGDMLTVSSIGGSVPTPLVRGVAYAVCNASGNTFKLGSTTLRTLYRRGYIRLGDFTIVFSTLTDDIPAGSTIVGDGIPAATTISSIKDTFACNMSAAATTTGIFLMKITVSVSNTTLTSAGSGSLSVSATPVYQSVRPYAWRNFAPLALPQNFTMVQ